jgi:spore coat polysaccharide biosynthesis protein SpsF
LIGCIIQARTGSSRLPNKVLMKIDENQTILEHVIKQLSFSKSINNIIVATTKLKQDDVIENLVKKLGINIFRGDSSDVLDRYYQCAKQFNLENIVRITSDCPLIDPEIVDEVIKKYETEGLDYVSNTLIRTFPIGMDVEIFSFDVLKKTWSNATLSSEREHVTPFMRSKKMDFSIGNVENNEDYSKIRITLDRKEDYELIKKIINKFDKKPILIQDIIKLFQNQPELMKINENIKHDEGMQKSLKNDKILAKIEIKND